MPRCTGRAVDRECPMSSGQVFRISLMREVQQSGTCIHVRRVDKKYEYLLTETQARIRARGLI